jgi:hypothetical protein
VKPLQKNLKIHLSGWNQFTVAQWPVWASESSIHHTGGTAYGHQNQGGYAHFPHQSTNKFLGLSLLGGRFILLF